VSAIARRFERATGRLLLNNDAKDRALVDQWREANRTFLRTFDRVRRIAETGTSHEARPTRDLNAAEEQVLRPLHSLQAIYETEIATRRAEQSAADTQALVGTKRAGHTLRTLLVTRSSERRRR
jgi:hypothetical protein